MIIYNSAPEEVFAGIYKYVIDDIIKYSHNEYSMCIIKKFLIYRNTYQGKYKKIFVKLKDVVDKEIFNILNSHYGNYLFHTMIEVSELYISFIVDIKLSKHIHASSTIEKFIEENEKTNFFVPFFTKLLTENLIEELLFDKYAKFVLISCIKQLYSIKTSNYQLYNDFLSEIKSILKENKHDSFNVSFCLDILRENHISLKEIHSKRRSQINLLGNNNFFYYPTSMQQYPMVYYINNTFESRFFNINDKVKGTTSTDITSKVIKKSNASNK